MDMLNSDSGPYDMLIHWLPSSGTADGSRLNNGFGSSASATPGGTAKPFPPPSGGTRPPLQDCLTTAGLAALLFAPGQSPASARLQNRGRILRPAGRLPP